MSGWMILNAKTERDSNHEANELRILCSKFENDERVYEWKAWNEYVYALMDTSRHNFDEAEQMLKDYRDLITEAIILSANDTSDTGTARYYDESHNFVDEYQETQSEDGYKVGEMALQVLGGRHNFIADDPWHNEIGHMDDWILKTGKERIDEMQKQIENGESSEEEKELEERVSSLEEKVDNLLEEE